MEIFYVLGGMVIFAAIVGLYNLFFCCKASPKPVPVVEEKKPKESKSCNELKAKQLEEESLANAQKKCEEFLKNNPDKYKFVVTLKDGTEFESEVFESSAEVRNSYYKYAVGSRPFQAEYYIYCCNSSSAKQKAELAKDNYGCSLGFMKVGDVEINVNEILLKEVVKVD